MVIVVGTVDVEAGLGDGAAANVEHVGQALADGGVERLVHEGHALGRGEVGGAQPGHGHAGGDSRGGVLGFGLDEDQRAAGDIEMALGDLLGPELTHLGGGGDGIGARGIRGLPLAKDDGGVAVHRLPDARILEGLLVFFSEHGHDLLSGQGFDESRGGWGRGTGSVGAEGAGKISRLGGDWAR